MIETTSNERFEEKIARECRELPSEATFVYAIVALATSLRTYLTREEILLAAGDASNQTLNVIEKLINQRLLVVRGVEIRLRHRVIAEHVIEHFKSEGQLREALVGLLWMAAAKAHPDLPRHSREHKLLRTMMNHEFMINLTDDRDTPRKAYDLIEDLQRSNYHYYLQRGSYEVEIGDLDLAKNLLEQARVLAPDDYKVQTEWAYMTLKRAALNASAPSAPDNAREAIAELEDAISRRGKDDPYPYHILGSQGLSWVRRAVMSKDEKAKLLRRLLNTVKEGIKNHGKARDLKQLAEDLEREYLLLVVP
jgi:tetratricopeptide (TPR) repeat protein